MTPADLLLRSQVLGANSGELMNVGVEQAGWEYTSLIVRRISPGESWSHTTGDDEVALVLLGGRCRVKAAGQEWRFGERANVFAGQPWALYLPRHADYRLTAETSVEVAVCGARAEEDYPATLIRPDDVAVEIRGAGNAARQINHIVTPEFPAHRLLVVEVFTPSGNWSSFPPHKHDVSNLPAEADLEEIYYYRIDPPDGFALQRLYSADARIDAAYVIRDGDLLLVPEGFHAFVVAHGYTGYYLNILAGDEAIRTMQPSDDPTYTWARDTWTPDLTDDLQSWQEIDERVNRGAGRRPSLGRPGGSPATQPPPKEYPMTTIRMTASQAIVRFLAEQYVARDGHEQRFFAGMFGIFGHGNVTGIGQALEEVGADLPYYQPRNEQGMVHTAAAYAKMKNRLQAFACTSSIGPGATNMVTGAAGATINRLPVLLLPGDIFASRKPHPVLQQLEYPASQDMSVNDCFRPISKYWDRIYRPEQLLSALPEAMRVLTDQADTGAVTLALPEDVQTEAYDYPARFFEKRVYRIDRLEPAAEALTRAVELVLAAERPLIVAGGGVIYSDATAALTELAESCGIPVVETQAGKGALPWNHRWNAGPIGSNGGLAANRLAADADLVIAVGTRMGDFTTASRTAFQHPDVRFVAVNVAPMDAIKLGALPLVADARAGMCALLDGLREAKFRTDDGYNERVTGLKREWDAAVDEQRRVTTEKQLTQANVIGIVNDASEPRDVVVCAAGGMPGDLLKLWRPVDPKGYHVEYGYSCMGYEIAGGLGVKMADPSREVYVMVGDGSYLMLHTEIVTSLQEGYKLTIVLVDNSGFQCIRGLQMSAGSPAFGNELRYRDPRSGRLDGEYMSIDFVQNAESLGARAYYADSEAALRDALQASTDETRTVLIHVPVDPNARVPGYESWWDVPVAEVSEEAGVLAALTQYQEAKTKQRFYY